MGLQVEKKVEISKQSVWKLAIARIARIIIDNNSNNKNTNTNIEEKVEISIE